MGIIGSIIGRREPSVEYRTIDGGHPAPYPDMTDEQLYNYEVTFNVPRRTFTKPPQACAPAEPVFHAEPKAPPRSADREPKLQPRMRQTTFNAPRYTARANKEHVEQQTVLQETPASPSIDFSKPVRIITSKLPVDIITTRARHPIYKVHGYVGNDDVVTVFTLDGRLSENGPRYLENVPQKQSLHLNIYASPKPDSNESYLITQHRTKEEAEAAAQPGRLACVEVEIDA